MVESDAKTNIVVTLGKQDTLDMGLKEIFTINLNIIDR